MSKRPIVKRLRRAAQEAQSLNATAGGLELDAAAEIERLQQLLREVGTVARTALDHPALGGTITAFKGLTSICERLAGWSAGEGELDPLAWIEQQTTLHHQVDILYVVDGYLVCIMDDRCRTLVGPWKGETVAEALRLAMKEHPGE